VNCPSCGAPVAPKPDTEGFQCVYCHSMFFPGKEDDGVQLSDVPAAQPVTDLCPLCSQALVHAQIASTPVLFCGECRGLLMPMNVLPGLVDQIHQKLEKPAVQAPPDHNDLKRVVRCPRCGQRMDTHFFAGPGNVIVDSCGGCFLLWLDRGELTRIAKAPDAGDKEDLVW
jgi:Zn-finger nucleic acid-binding protein